MYDLCWTFGVLIGLGRHVAWPPELGSSRPSPPGLVQGYPPGCFPFGLFCFGRFWFLFVGVREVLNSVLSIERTGAYSGVSGFNFWLKSLGPAAAFLPLVVFPIFCVLFCLGCVLCWTDGWMDGWMDEQGPHR